MLKLHTFPRSPSLDEELALQHTSHPLKTPVTQGSPPPLLQQERYAIMR